ncbi:uncharacterized protein MONOS_7196 [Monocercomonoides exilis]|uniref:uncharacterized protein n=1 Tax=Monocercomonoides exilis TaxID=2049356 RepID=UPI00355A8D17|nr:hypothetical protein MONOS_7196 [Monocercomonoides exilis]
MSSTPQTEQSHPQYTVRTIQPKPRELQRTTKDYTEKSRLIERTGGYARADVSADIITPAVKHPKLYISESDRFGTDFASEDKAEREAKKRRAEEIRAKKCEEQLEREKKHWETVIRTQDSEEHRALSHGTKKNTSGIAYDPVTLEYKDTLDGDRLRYADEGKRYRSEVRKQTLYNSANRSGYNPVTGEPLSFAHQPEPTKPAMPPRLAEAIGDGKAKL